MWPRRMFLCLPLAALADRSVTGAANEVHTQIRNLYELPPNLPIPKDDGAARHLRGMTLPDLELPSTSNRLVKLSKIRSRRLVVYCYPRTGEPGKPPSPPGWDDIPGARGCTPETCGFRDHHTDLAKLGADVFGVSSQSTAYQREMVTRLKVAIRRAQRRAPVVYESIALAHVHDQ